MQKQQDTVTISTLEYERFQHLESELAYFKQQLADLKRLIFGRSSERFIPADNAQLGLFANEPVAESTPETEQVSYERKKPSKEKQQPVRVVLPAHFPREEEIIEPENLSPDARKIGEEVTEILEYTPSSIYVRRIVRPKYVSRQSEGVRIAPMPSLPIPKGNAGAGLLAHIQVSKWVDHLPYYRQIQIFRRSGLELGESTVNSWFNATCDLLEPLYSLLVKQVQAQKYLQADESPIPVQDKPTKGGTHTGYHWVYHAPLAKMAVFDYRPSRSREGPALFLKDFRGTLQTDGYAAYNELGKAGNLTMLACMAHARRYFEKALDNDEKRATHALGVIKQLYALERDCVEQGFDAQKVLEHRQVHALPILGGLKTWLDGQQPVLTPKSRIGQAVNYTLSLWPRLARYVEDGSYLIDNNRIENCIRPLALGRKNYLFAGSHQAAQRAAMMYSFFATCKMNGVNPYQWLRDVLNRIPEHRVNRLHELLPNNWAEPK